MNKKNFAEIEKKTNKLIKSLNKKHTQLLKKLSVSILSAENFRYSLCRQKDIKQIYFTKDEIEYCKNRVSSLVGRYAAKIAVRKVLGKKIPWKSINILSSRSGEPFLLFTNKLSDKNISVSITHEEDLVAALAVFGHKKTISVGLDATDISRIENLLKQTKILRKILTPEELKEVDNLKNEPDLIKKAVAEKWTGKEAISKALGIGIWHGASLREIEILTDKKKHFVRLNGKISTLAKNKGFSHYELDFIKTPKFVLAFALNTD